MSENFDSKLLTALYDISDFASSFTGNLEEDKIWSRLLDKLCVALDAEAASYFTYIPTTGYLLPIHAIGPRADEIKEVTVHVKTGVIGWVVLHREPVVVGDVHKDSRFLKDVDQVIGFETKTVIAIPILENLELVGVIELINKVSGPFTQEDLRFVRTACDIVGLGIRHLKLGSVIEKVTLRNATILENLTGGFIAIDLHGRVIILNPAAKRILDLPEAVKMNLPADQTLTTAPAFAKILLETISNRRSVRRQEMNWAHGERRRVIGYSTILLKDTRGEVTGAGITFQDITP